MNKQLWKKIIRRALIGMPIGLTIGTIITIINSLNVGDGKYYAVVPALIQDCGSEIKAVLIQALCNLLYGAVVGASSLIWDTNWSLTKMTVAHLIAIALSVLPAAYFLHWMKHTFVGFLAYFGAFLLVYAILWFIIYRKTRRSVEDMNRKVQTGI